MNSFVKRLREAKGWDLAQIYCKGFPPFMLNREAAQLTEEEDCLIIPGAKQQAPIRLSPTETATVTESVIHLEEIVRIDFLKFNRIETAPVSPGLILP